MNIIEYNNSSSENGIQNNQCHKDKDYAVFAIGGGAINSIRKAFEDTNLRDHVYFFQCDKEHTSCSSVVSQDMNNADIRSACDNILESYSFDKAIIISTLGGRTGTEYAPAFSKYFADKEIELINIVTLPFSFEGKSRYEKSQKALAEMSQFAKTTMVYNGDSFKKLLKDENIADYFSILDNHIEKAILFAVS